MKYIRPVPIRLAQKRCRQVEKIYLKGEILRFLVSGHWEDWESWDDCKVFPIDRTRKFSHRTRVCHCDVSRNCKNNCVGKAKERKICSCADGYIPEGDNELMPCKPDPTKAFLVLSGSNKPFIVDFDGKNFHGYSILLTVNFKIFRQVA